MIFNADGKINYMQMWYLLKRFWILIAVLALFFGVSGYLCARFLIRPTYTATTQIVVWPENILTAEDMLETLPNRDAYTLQSNTTRMLSSQLALSNMLVPDFQALLNSRLLHSKLDQRLAKKVGADFDYGYTLAATPIRETRFVDVTVTSHDKERAPLIVNEAVAVFSEEAVSILGINNIKLIDPAQSAVRVGPKVRLYLLGGLLLGAALGCGIVLLIDFLDKSVYDFEQLERTTKLSILGVLPEIPVTAGQRGRELWQESDNSSFGEALRALRVNIEFLLPETGKGKIFLVSSVTKGEGKSAIFGSLAVAMSKINKKILLIDADLRRPRVHRQFKLQNKCGLVDFLATNKSFDTLVNRNVPCPGMDVLTCGPIPVAPSDLLSSDRLVEFLEEMRNQYDYIFLDAPPCIGLADPMILGKISDAVLLIVDSEKANRDKIVSAVERLRAGNLHLAGLVINRLSAKTQKDYYYNYYYSQYYSYKYRNYATDEGAAETLPLDEGAEVASKPGSGAEKS